MTLIPFNEADKMNPLWDKFMSHFAARLDALRTLNDRDADERTTAANRGRIAEIKGWLAKNETPPIID